MKKLYAVELKKERLVMKDARLHHRILPFRFNTALSFKEAVNLIAEKGVESVLKIRHDDKNPRNTKLLTGIEILRFWKEVNSNSN